MNSKVFEIELVSFLFGWHCQLLFSPDLLHQGYSGRAAVLYQAGNFRLCIDDLKSALDLSVAQSSNAYLLLDRKAKCLLELGKVSEAREDFKKALDAAEKGEEILPRMKEIFSKQIEDNLAKLTPEEEERLKEGADSREDFFSLLISEDDKKSEFLRTTPNVVWNEKARISYGGPEVGRLLRAEQDIQPGELIAIESPLASFTQCDNGTSKVCHHCLGNFYMNGAIFFPSPIVTGIRFCSYDCLRTAIETYHQHEQFILADYLQKLSSNKEAVELSGCMFLAFRGLVRRPSGFYTSKVAKDIMSRTDVEYGCDKIPDGEIELDEELRFLWNLVDHDEHEPLENKIRMSIRSVILVKCLKESGYFTDYDAQHFAVLWALYKLQMSMTYNIHTVYKVGGNISGDIPLSGVGSAVYRYVGIIFKVKYRFIQSSFTERWFC